MRIKILLLIVGAVLPIMSNAGKIYPGIYKTANDFKRNSISIVADTTQHKAIRIDDFFFRPYVWIKTINGKQKIPKKDVFAVIMPNRTVYRIVNNENYQLLDTAFICIYSKEREISIPTVTVHTTRYGREKVSEYFFSTNIAGLIQPLNKTNLRLALLKEKKLTII
jgi:hypothetical protein